MQDKMAVAPVATVPAPARQRRPGKIGQMSARGDISFLWNLRRRLEWFTHQLTLGRLANGLCAAGSYALGLKRPLSMPVVVKVDVTPQCNLRCTMCIHAKAHGRPRLEKQHFSSDQIIPLDQYAKLINEIKRWTSAVSLYYMGEPLMHPQIEDICKITAAAKLNSHMSTNLSFRLSDERIEGILTSGLTHLTVCLDGMTQETYGMTRVGGRIQLVLDNLRRFCEAKVRLGLEYPSIEVQYIRFQHNLHQMEIARQACEEMGVDRFASFWGALHNTTDMDAGTYRVGAPKKRALRPRCTNPWLMALVKYNGDVIPCCSRRLGQQCTSDESHAIGNVFGMSLRRVWRGKTYQRIRQLVVNPALGDQDPACRDLFCDQCPNLYATEYGKCCIAGDVHKFEEFYVMDEHGLPVPKSTLAIQPQAQEP
jgi:MoaA/NifB/PqqE/SkfB family radical SAM enzyme